MIEISGDGVTASISLEAGTVTAAFQVGDAVVEPFYEAPWLGQWHEDPMLAKLRGDFLCVPFGMPGHGYSAANMWSLVEQSSAEALISVDYPQGDAVRRLTRRVTCKGGGLEFEDRIEVDQEVSLPLGLHPMFRLPESPGGARLELPAAGAVLTPPERPEPTSRLLPDQRFTDATQAPSVDGVADITRLPWENPSEDIALLANVAGGRIALVLDDYKVVMAWDADVLKHCLLWISNRGRDYEPWNSRNLCLGIEPITSLFDHGAAASVAPNALADAGIPTAVELRPDSETVIRHSIQVLPAS